MFGESEILSHAAVADSAIIIIQNMELDKVCQ